MEWLQQGWVQNLLFALAGIVATALVAYWIYWKQKRDAEKQRTIKTLALDYRVNRIVDVGLLPVQLTPYPKDIHIPRIGHQVVADVTFIVGNKGNVTLTKDDFNSLPRLHFKNSVREIIESQNLKTLGSEKVEIKQVAFKDYTYNLVFDKLAPGDATKFTWTIGIPEASIDMFITCDIKGQTKKDSISVTRHTGRTLNIIRHVEIGFLSFTLAMLGLLFANTASRAELLGSFAHEIIFWISMFILLWVIFLVARITREHRKESEVVDTGYEGLTI